MLLFGIAFLTLAIGFAMFLVFSSIVAHEDGITWLGFRGWRSVAWVDVTNYYFVAMPKGGPTTRIESPDHTFVLSDDSWTNLPELRAYVQEHATNSTSLEWSNHTPYSSHGEN